jgi:hypothetical protein
MASLYFDGDKRRIYEVPTDASFTVSGDGYRIYSGPGEADVRFTSTGLWSAWVDWHSVNKWSTLALVKTGGAFRFNDGVDDIFATFDLRLFNGWALVQADYAHNFTLLGNLFPDDGTGKIFDTDRITSSGVSPRIFYADSLQVLRSSGGSSPAAIAAAVWNAPRPDHVEVDSFGEKVGRRATFAEEGNGIIRESD